MFTGIVEEIGVVRGTSPDKLTVDASVVLENVKLGDSMAVNGVCLTVVALSGSSFTMDIMPETLRRTNLGMLRYGTHVNLERAMPAAGRFGGHFVLGHVDGMGKVISMTPEGEAIITRIFSPGELMTYVVNKGFIAVDGVSLTVIDCDEVSFSVSLVAYTRKHTTLGTRKAGDMVNLEVDIIAKYVERLRHSGSHGITLEILEEQGFLKVR